MQYVTNIIEDKTQNIKNSNGCAHLTDGLHG